MTGARAFRVPDYLAHILQAIIRIETYTAGLDQQAFIASPMLQDAVIRNVEIIGEAENNILKLDGGFGKRHPGIPLNAAYAMRNSLSHGYFLVDPILVWGTVKSDLPGLKTQIADALKNYTQP
jgi:uncharacterized protein with HEPN domain